MGDDDTISPYFADASAFSSLSPLILRGAGGLRLLFHVRAIPALPTASFLHFFHIRWCLSTRSAWLFFFSFVLSWGGCLVSEAHCSHRLGVYASFTRVSSCAVGGGRFLYTPFVFISRFEDAFMSSYFCATRVLFFFCAPFHPQRVLYPFLCVGPFCLLPPENQIPL
ncbi:hypothetical protein C8J57DRAFT_219132 [Mycena rebaudengoi]|nr:hypothetical protein C8J57DRAFT_219132 [Mycena rebaudengoi]